MASPDRHWLLTWTTYGTWLPGDERGFFSSVHDDQGGRIIHNVAGSSIDRNRPELKQAAMQLLKGPPVFLVESQANILLAQFQETAQHRDWTLLAVAVMRAHIHMVVGVPGDPSPERLLGDFKAYGSRALNREFGRRQSGTWWTDSGSTRKKRGHAAIVAAVRYVARQSNPLIVWVHPDWQKYVV